MSLKLRRWQQEAVSQATAKFRQGQKQFFCLAATATGKTVMAAETAKQLLADDAIDLIIAFCPSNEIQQGIQNTLNRQLGVNCDGSIKSIGAVYTYQSMLTLDQSFWELLTQQRVMVIFDEIHHCAGSAFSKRNAWGAQIINHIIDQAFFVLSLSGTPWRSDQLPITAANYNDEGQIACDFQYGLAEAVAEGVCRKPNLVLLDNQQIKVNIDANVTTFESLSAALKDSPLNYLTVIQDSKAQHYLMQKAVKKLRQLRKINPAAGGLVVASCIEHAETLAQLIRNQFNEQVWVVSYLHPNSQQIINKFRHSDVPWIVSVGMISEGTDIPRAQVCCHLSHIRTEMHFRQILGRILRINHAENQEAWLYTFAECNLSIFAKRLAIDLPDAQVKFETMKADTEITESHQLNPGKTYLEQQSPMELSFDLAESSTALIDKDLPPADLAEVLVQEKSFIEFELNEAAFIEQLIGLYEDDNNIVPVVK